VLLEGREDHRVLGGVAHEHRGRLLIPHALTSS
jgi:hypothetical protein